MTAAALVALTALAVLLTAADAPADEPARIAPQ
jgi:hypothetical protein